MLEADPSCIPKIIEPSSKLPSSRVTVEICKVASGSNSFKFISKTLNNLLKSEGATSGVPQIGSPASISLDTILPLLLKSKRVAPNRQLTPVAVSSPSILKASCLALTLTSIFVVLSRTDFVSEVVKELALKSLFFKT